jgi:hypothetical protein
VRRHSRRNKRDVGLARLIEPEARTCKVGLPNHVPSCQAGASNRAYLALCDQYHRLLLVLSQPFAMEASEQSLRLGGTLGSVVV